MFKLTRRQFVAGSTSLLFTSGSLARAAPSGELRIVALPSIFGDMYNALRDAHQGEHKATVNVDTSIREDETAITAILRSAVVGELPDILFISPNYLRVFADRQLAQKLDAFQHNEADWGGNFAPTVMQIGGFGGSTRGLGFAVSMPVVLYNLDLLARVGGGEPPESWEGITALGRKIDELREGNVVGAFMEYDNGGNWTFHGLLNGFGGRILTKVERDIGFAGPEGLAALRVLRDFGQCGQARVDMSRDQARQAFSAGQLGILCTSSSSYAAIEKRAAGQFAIGMRPFPVTAQAGYLPAAGPISIMFSRDPQQQQRAWEFMKFASSVPGQTIMATRTTYLPANDLALKTRQLGDYYASRPNVRALIPALQKMGPWEAFPGKNSVKITTVIKNHLATVVLLKAAPEQVLEHMARDVTDLLPLH
ncbi:extracellular solute-binding protein [Mesorhizobium intechi]|uniref:Extracellular solute-binding protein n=1 Tax=Mesorhizobium intechi TaxID=537601 RepID=A0A8T9ALF2_9HYPH|nr:extracellular solute-binding protein [Mesorhizobium intechi]TSE03659.1 extracellular solute-binding protein [Mesorhizobium intechi]